MQKYRNYKLAMKLGNSRAWEKPYKLLGALCFLPPRENFGLRTETPIHGNWMPEN